MTAEHGGIHAARALKGAGITTVFGLPGGHILPLFEGCRREGIRLVDTRHEEGAAMAALGWALATGDAGVCAVTAGPGVVNAFPGVAEARGFGAPLVVIAGRTGLRQHNRGSVQDLDQTAIMGTVAKWAQTCFKAERIPDYVAEALHRARAGVPGPTFLDIPQDLFMMETELPERSTPFGYPDRELRSAPRGSDLEEAVSLLEGAERPIVLAGGGAFWSGASEALKAFGERSGIPVTTTSSARGIVSDDHDLCLGSLIHGGIGTASADVVLVLGSRFNANLSYGGHPLFQPGQTVIQVDAAPESVGGNRRPDLAVPADARTFLEAATEAWTASPDRLAGWAERCREAAQTSRDSWDAQTTHRSERINPGWLAREVATFAHGLGRHTIVCDGGDALVWGLAFAAATGPGRHLFTGTDLGTLGVGMPFALAATAARPDEPTFLFTGDGSFGLSAMEFETAVRHGLPMVVVVANNGGWGDVRHEQRAFFGDEADRGAVLSDMRYDLLARAMGGHGERVESPDEVVPALKRALDAGAPSLLDCRTDPDVESELIKGLSSLDVM